MYRIQILLVLFFLLAIWKVIGRKRVNELSLRTAISWITFWLLAIYVVLQPDITSKIAKIFGVGRGADIVVYFGLAALFFIVFRLMVKIEKINREVTNIVREKALNEKK